MKKIYLSPVTETVNVKLYGSILDGIGVVDNSHDVSDDGEAKENNILFEDDFGNIWSDSEGEPSPYDLWGE